MALPGNLALACVRGDTLRRSMTWTADGEPVDLTDCTALMQARDANGEVVLEITTTAGDSGGVTLGDDEGTIAIHVTPAGTDVAANSYDYDLEITFPGAGGDVQTVVRGTLTVESDVSREEESP